MENAVISRFAPSPTGWLHLGNARTALLAWWSARAQGGRFLLRIEDLDPDRSRADVEESLVEDLRYLGIDWDDVPWRQSERGANYRTALDTLAANDLVYPCFCSRADIARVASAPQGDEGPRYPGTCSQLSTLQRSERERTRPPAWRFRVRPGEVRFSDALHGEVRQDVAREVGDFVVQRIDGVASYQLAVVVDDDAAGVNEVVRADDLLASTPRQLLLYEALGHPAPRYAHVPLLLSASKERLAKRSGGTTVREQRLRGTPAARVIGWLAWTVGLSPLEPASTTSLIRGFDWRRLKSESAEIIWAKLTTL